MAGLEASLERFGVVQPIIFNRRTGFVVGGHQRLKALKKKKIKETPVVIVELDEMDEKALNVALNSPHISGEFTASLQPILEALQAADDVLFRSLLLDQLLGEAEPLPPAGDPEDAPPLEQEPSAKLGDVYELGIHRLVCGDSANPEVYQALLRQECVDMLLTDPPYGVDYVAKDNAMRKATGQRSSGHREIANDVKVEGGYRQWFASWLSLIPWSNPAIFYIFMSGQELHSLRGAIDDCGFTWGDYLIWLKNAAVFGRKDYKAKTEWCLQGWPDTDDALLPEMQPDTGPEFALYGWPETHRFYGPKNATTVLEFDRPKKNDLHPTMKPIALLERLISDGSPPGSIVLDCFGGSGSTLMACEITGRRARLIELDPLYCDVIIRRWQTYTGQQARLLTPE